MQIKTKNKNILLADIFYFNGIIETVNFIDVIGIVSNDSGPLELS